MKKLLLSTLIMFGVSSFIFAQTADRTGNVRNVTSKTAETNTLTTSATLATSATPIDVVIDADGNAAKPKATKETEKAKKIKSDIEKKQEMKLTEDMKPAVTKEN